MVVLFSVINRGWGGGREVGVNLYLKWVPSCLFINIWKGKLLSLLLNCVIDFCSNRSCFISLWHSCGTFCTNVRELRGTRRLSRNRGPLLHAGSQDRDCAAVHPLCIQGAVPPRLSLGWVSLSRLPLRTALEWESRCRSPWLTYCRVVGKFKIESQYSQSQYIDIDIILKPTAESESLHKRWQLCISVHSGSFFCKSCCVYLSILAVALLHHHAGHALDAVSSVVLVVGLPGHILQVLHVRANEHVPQLHEIAVCRVLHCEAQRVRRLSSRYSGIKRNPKSRSRLELLYLLRYPKGRDDLAPSCL